MDVEITWLGHASFRISAEGKVVYIDPWKLKDGVGDADLVLVSHGHYDHYSAEDIGKISGADCTLVGAADVVSSHGSGETIAPGQTVEIAGIRIEAVAAYNPSKQFHPRGNEWVGFVVEMAGKRIYYAGDTDVIEEMSTLGEIDLALLPVGGTYTMDAEQAAEAVRRIRPKAAMAYHWGDIVGGKEDAEEFIEAAGSRCEIALLEPGQTMTL